MKEKARKDIRMDKNTVFSNCKKCNGIDTFITIYTVKISGSLKVKTIPLLLVAIYETIYAWL